MTMMQWIAIGGLITTLALCSLLVSVYALFSAHRLAHKATTAVDAVREECAVSIESMRSRLDGAAAELEEASRRRISEPLPGSPKSSMNLTKRSQALRMRKKGESPQEIAQALAMPRQEVELLLKVHDIVLSNV